jgi:hypothetical protein
MLFRDFVELLYKAYLEDRGILKTLRDKLKDGSYLQDLEDDPDLQDWQEINPRSIDPRRTGRSKYYPNTFDPQQGVRVFESVQSKYPKAYKKIQEIIKERNSRNVEDRR